MDEEPTEEVKQETSASNGGKRYHLRQRKGLQRFPNEEHVLLTDEGEPEIFEKAKRDTHNLEWLSDMQDEMDSLHENNTYELTKLPKGKKPLRNKWVYKMKSLDGRNPPKYKARIVVKGF